MPCDCILHTDLDNLPQTNWIGTTKVSHDESKSYCNLKVKNGLVHEIRDKQTCNSDYVAFSAPLFVKDHKIFWEGLKNNKKIENEHQISNGIISLFQKSTLTAVDIKWEDIGDFKKYKKILSESENFDFSKPNEFIYFVNNMVIKFSTESENILQLISKLKIHSDIFPKIKSSGKNFFCYDYFKGSIFYNLNDISKFESLLNWLEKNLWYAVNIEDKKMKNLCKKFYYEKTIKRINNFKEKYENYELPLSVNGNNIHSLDQILEKISWDELFNGIPCFIHGDLNFGNILYSKNEFCLIDCRPNFAGFVEFGDLYYDLAKLYAGLIINFQDIRDNNFKYIESNQNAKIYLKKWELQESLIEKFESYIISKNLDFKRIKILAGITFLNMAPLHNSPFDRLLMAFGSKLINDQIFTNNNTI
jgi:thiamine kinase-like enzyme